MLIYFYLFLRATWHPLVDMVVVGRYPDEKFQDFVPGELRTIDCIDADSGVNLLQLHEPGINKISSLNQVNKKNCSKTMKVFKKQFYKI